MADHEDVRSQGGSLDVVPTLVRDPQPVEFERLLERRRLLGQDLLDEVWRLSTTCIPRRTAGTQTSSSSSRCFWTRRHGRPGSVRV